VGGADGGDGWAEADAKGTEELRWTALWRAAVLMSWRRAAALRSLRDSACEKRFWAEMRRPGTQQGDRLPPRMPERDFYGTEKT
jgi:hypothetical protein